MRPRWSCVKDEKTDEPTADHTEGAFFVYHGGVDGLAETHAWSAEGDQEGAGLGDAVSATGDVDGDNYGDIIVGAPTYNDGGTDAGSSFRLPGE